MANTKKRASTSGPRRKRSPKAMAKAIRATEAKATAAVYSVLRKAGLAGVMVHSINFSVDPDVMTQPGCDNCDLRTHNCVQTPDGWVCVPKA